MRRCLTNHLLTYAPGKSSRTSQASGGQDPLSMLHRHAGLRGMLLVSSALLLLPSQPIKSSQPPVPEVPAVAPDPSELAPLPPVPPVSPPAEPPVPPSVGGGAAVPQSWGAMMPARSSTVIMYAPAPYPTMGMLP